MTEKIEPALSAEEWAGKVEYEYSVNHGSEYLADGPEAAHKIIALANHELPDDDPRKITREKLTAFVRMDLRGPPGVPGHFTEFLRALESYLPPE